MQQQGRFCFSYLTSLSFHSLPTLSSLSALLTIVITSQQHHLPLGSPKPFVCSYLDSAIMCELSSQNIYERRTIRSEEWLEFLVCQKLLGTTSSIRPPTYKTHGVVAGWIQKIVFGLYNQIISAFHPGQPAKGVESNTLCGGQNAVPASIYADEAAKFRVTSVVGK